FDRRGPVWRVTSGANGLQYRRSKGPERGPLTWVKMNRSPAPPRHSPLEASIEMKTLATLFTALVLALAGYALACPFCTVESQTLAAEIADSCVAVIAFLVKPAAPPADGPDSLGEFGVVDPDTGRAQFRIARVEKGSELVAGMETFETVYFGD